MDNDIELIEKKNNKIEKKFYIEIILCITISLVLFIVIPVIILIIVMKNADIFNIKFNYEIVQSNTGFQNILVKWASNETFNISISVKGVENEVIRIYNILNTNQSEQLVKVYFGIPKLHIVVQKNEKKNEIIREFNVVPKEVVIAAFHASLPALIFSLDIFNITEKFNCPIYVSLERYKAWKWDKLPEGVFLFDILDENNFYKIDFYDILVKLKLWMAQMYKVNNKVIFNLFLTDIHNFIIPFCIYSNNIPSENYRIFLLSDGTASYMYFNEKFDNNQTYLNTYNQMKYKYEEFKSYVWNSKNYDTSSSYSKNLNHGDLHYYSYIITKVEKNSFWWLTKIKGVFAPNNPTILEELLNDSKIELKDLNYLFKSLNDEQKEQIKDLFNFNSNFFEEAYKLNKSVMLIAGTTEHVEYNLYDYCLTTELLYKNDYIYYYKAHPQTPIENNQTKAEKLKNIGITPIDSNIPLEVIIFFNPNIFCSGYYTSSFIEVGKEVLKSLFDQYKKEDEYFSKFDYFCKYIKKDNQKYGQYLENNNDGIIIEINKQKLIDFEYDFGVYLKDINSIKYYKNNIIDK